MTLPDKLLSCIGALQRLGPGLADRIQLAISLMLNRHMSTPKWPEVGHGLTARPGYCWPRQP